MSFKEKIQKRASEIIEQELIRIRQNQVTPSFDDIHRMVNKVVEDAVAMYEEAVASTKQKLSFKLDDIAQKLEDYVGDEAFTYAWFRKLLASLEIYGFYGNMRG